MPPQNTHSPNVLPRFTSPRVRAQEMTTRILTNVLDVIDAINDQEKRNFKLGVVFLIIAIATWLIGLELVNSVLKGDEYSKPFFLAFLTGSCFSLNFLPDIYRYVTTGFDHSGGDHFKYSPLLSHSDLEVDPEPILDSVRRVEKNEMGANEPIPLTRREILSLASKLSVIYFAYNALVMLALQYTSASNQTVLGSTTAVFTLFIGVYLNIDRLTIKKLACVATSLLGVVLINISEQGATSSDDENKFKPKNPALGNFYALLGALCYAMYLLVMKLECGTENKTTNERQLFGCVGVFTFLFGIPVLCVVHYFGIEEFQLPPNLAVFSMILINSVFSVISDYVTILAMLLTSPLVTSLALTSSIPIAIFCDFMILALTGGENNSSTSSLLTYAFGVLSILMSVILINVNVTSENEFIEEVIEEALEDAIRNDEVLSPMLSPYLGSASTTALSPSNHNIGINLSPRSLLFGRRNNTHTNAPPLFREVSGFTLGESTSESTPLHNANHNRSLYTIDTRLTDGPQGDTGSANLLVSGGVNHNYVVKSIDQST